MTTNKSPLIGISRHRINTDGNGVTTLVAFHGCPLRCRYCLNPQCLRSDGVWRSLSPEEVLETVSIDNLYFLATDGGITFGGGEPLLRPEFLTEFKKICNPKWKISVETSMNVEIDAVKATEDIIDSYIIDIKDLDPDTYKAYTGRDNHRVIQNLRHLAKYSDRIIIKTPYIEGFNTRASVDDEELELNKMGFRNIMKTDYVTVEKRK